MNDQAGAPEGADLSDIANTPFPYVVGGQQMMFARLSVGKLFAAQEQRVKNERMQNASELVQQLHPSAQAEFMQGVLNDLPTGEELSQLVQASMASVSGLAFILHLSTVQAGQPVAEDVLVNLIDPQATDVLKPLLGKVCSIKFKEKDPNEPAPTTGQT